MTADYGRQLVLKDGSVGQFSAGWAQDGLPEWSLLIAPAGHQRLQSTPVGIAAGDRDLRESARQARRVTEATWVPWRQLRPQRRADGSRRRGSGGRCWILAAVLDPGARWTGRRGPRSTAASSTRRHATCRALESGRWPFSTSTAYMTMRAATRRHLCRQSRQHHRLLRRRHVRHRRARPPASPVTAIPEQSRQRVVGRSSPCPPASRRAPGEVTGRRVVLQVVRLVR